jgi:hypothetical protein
MARVKFDFDGAQVRKNLQTMPRRFEIAMTGLNDYWATSATEFMKTNARWTDRTAAARTSLNATPVHRAGSPHWAINLAHGVRYGFWLEVAHGRKYEILQTTMRVIGRAYFQSVQRVLANM